MATPSYHRWAPRLATLALWVLAGASAVYWGLQLSGRAAGPAPAAAAPEPVAADAQALARLLGAQAVSAPEAPAAASRFVLLGLLAGTASGDGAALIAVDGKPARPYPYRVGASVEPGLVLQSLSRREARLGASVDGATTLTLEMPRPKGD
ncbi:type II secretion system protein N [Alicycliphilus denitrificans]|uniref:General secretion pathway protein C n=1 Tax=Alicycliphilus denitrificans TaxID=179636 RepID=A0A420KEU8_9BURK|nr:type II secretion system protein N [Alicycliphilus denitrificans]RKJ98459.1 general secretion pathway protein C [Alicycliphilus denitrificans]